MVCLPLVSRDVEIALAFSIDHMSSSNWLKTDWWPRPFRYIDKMETAESVQHCTLNLLPVMSTPGYSTGTLNALHVAVLPSMPALMGSKYQVYVQKCVNSDTWLFFFYSLS